jgi:hypothetical protein
MTTIFCLALDFTSVEWDQLSDVMPDIYEDNFGFYAVGDDPNERAFFSYIKRTSVLKVCARCNQIVYLQPQKEICATCAEGIAYGGLI